ncbi:MAG: hypothetical protein ACOYL6_18905 [Bacteriovoracaceae bacterium]
MKKPILFLCASLFFINSSYCSTEKDVVRLFSSTDFEKIKSKELSDNFFFSSIDFMEQRDECSSGTCQRTRTFKIAYENISVAGSVCNLIVEFSYNNDEKQIAIKEPKKNCN